MARISQLAVFAAIFMTLAAGTVVLNTASVTTNSFTSAPVKVFDQTNTTDTTAWATVPYTQVALGSGAINTTAYLWGWTVAANAFTGVISRSINTTILTNSSLSSDTTELSVGADKTAAVTWAYNSGTTPVAGAGGGYAAWAYVKDDAATVVCPQLYLSIVAGGATAATATKVALTANTGVTAVAGTTDGVTYAYNVKSVWYQDGVFYVLWVTQTTTTDKGTARLLAVGAATTKDTAIYVQGVNITSGAVVWTAATAVVSGLTNDQGTVLAVAGPSNYTGAASVYVAYSLAATTSPVVYNTIKVSDGTLGTAANTVSSSSTARVETTTDGSVLTYAPTGFLYGAITGVLVSNTSVFTAKAADSSAVTTYGLGLYNVTGSAVSTSGIAATGATGSFAGTGYAYNSTAYAIISSYASAAAASPQPATTTYVYGVFNSSGSAAVSQTTIGSSNGATASYFQDVNASAVWYGYATYDVTADAGTILQAVYLGKLASLAVTSTSAGTILASFFSFLFFVVAALFAF